MAKAKTKTKTKTGRAPRRAAPRSSQIVAEVESLTGRPPALVPVGSEAPPFLVAAVGASAGGLVAFSGLLRRMPAEAPLALMLVQHLSPDHRSLLPELLSATTELKVETARDGLAIQSGHVYVISPDIHMTVSDGHVRIHPRPQLRLGTEGPVDALFRSVAGQFRDRAVGVVLSGSAHDGAAGIKTIKEAGGITLVQSPGEAEIDGMPRAAIATGAVDAVLPVEEIAEQLLRLSAHPFFRQPAEYTDVELDRPTVSNQRRRLFQLMRRTTGVDFNNYKSPTITRRIHRRMALHRIATLEEYVTHLEQDSQELQRLQEDLLIHVTSFFREADSFAALQQMLKHRVSSGDRESTFRAWVPGCSTGEEAYSVAILLLELLGDRAEFVPLQIFGTDVSEVSIERARAGVYPASILADIAPDRLRRFFTPFDGGYRINKVVRDACVFARQDVTRDPPFSRLDLVVCRNLLIYLTPPAQRKVMGIFHYAIQPTGILMLGRSETIGNNGDLFAVLDKKAQLHARKQGQARMEIDFHPVRALTRELRMSEKEGKAEVAEVAVKPVADWDVQSEANRLLLDRYAPPAVMIDEDFRISRARGSTGRYLELPSGDVSLDLLKMVRPELLFGLRALVQEARARGTPVSREGLKLRDNGASHTVNLHVVPLGRSGPRQFMVLFEDGAGRVGGAMRPSSPPRKRGRATSQPETDTVDLQHELVETRYQLQAIIDDLAAANEELQSANEEVLSSNEELQSTNEELDTAKEELQSTNEELSTLNDELHGRNEELGRANSDMVNLLNSVQIPIVMVGQDLRIRRFTPAAERTLNVIPSDVGRPIGHLKPNFRCPDLEPLISNVIDNITVFDGEVEGHDGRMYALQIRPYKSVDNRIDGAVVALIDISVARNQESVLALAKETGEAFIALAHDPMLLLDATLTVQKVNAAFVDRFKLSTGDVQGRSVFAVDDGAWAFPELRQLLQHGLAQHKAIDDNRVEHTFPRLGKRRLAIDARRIDAGLGGGGMVLVVIREGAADES